MATDRLETITNRLEAVAVKLESLSARGGRGGGGGDETPEFVTAFEEILKGPLAEYVSLSSKIGSDVDEAGKMVQKAFNITYETLKTVAVSKKPANDKLPLVLKPLGNMIEEIKTYCNKKFKSDFKPHLDTISSFVVALGWIPTPMKPHAFIKDTIDSGMFYSNRILTAFKDKGPDHKSWVQATIKLYKDLETYVQDFHSSGCTWNPKGKDAQAPSGSGGAAPSSAPAPAPAAAAAASKPSGGAPSMGALFSQINQGTGITGGLKRVDDSQKTHKNPGLRAGATVGDAPKAKAAPAGGAKKAEAASGPPVFELQNRKWVVENQKDQQMLEVNEGDKSYSVSMWKCVNTNVKVGPKINTISMEACQNCKVQVCAGLISSCEVVNCKKIEIHTEEPLPFITIDNCDGVQVYLTEKTIGTQVSTSCSVGVNICIWKNDTDLIEHPVPYQFCSKLVNGKLVTEVAESV